jgi:hypothetical protein
VSEPKRRVQVFGLGISLVRKVHRVTESSAYLLLVYAVVVPDAAVKEAIGKLYKELVSDATSQAGGSIMMLGALAHVSRVRIPLTVSTGCHWKIYIKSWTRRSR